MNDEPPNRDLIGHVVMLLLVTVVFMVFFSVLTGCERQAPGADPPSSVSIPRPPGLIAPHARIDCPASSRVGDPVVVSAARSVKHRHLFTVVPALHGDPFEDSATGRMTFTPQAPGQYAIVLCVSNDVGEIDRAVRVIEVYPRGTLVAATAEIAPDMPLERLVRRWRADVDLDDVSGLAASSAAVAASFAEIAKLCQDGSIETPSQWLTTLDAALQKHLAGDYERWAPWLEHLRAELNALEAEGRLSTIAEYGSVSEEIAVAMRPE